MFRALFDPLRAPPAKAMGLLQSSFLDSLDESRAKLQVAWVIDGTTSMGPALEALKQSMPDMVGDLRRRHGEHVSFALVVYRDEGAAEGRVSAPVPTFITDPNQFLDAVQSIRLDSGAPYFLEPVDEGVHRGLQLPWDEADDTTRWMIVAADAPPFGDGLEDSSLGAVRRFTTKILVDEANRKKVVIHGLLCRSNAEDYPAFKEVLDRTRRFLGDLALGANGQLLDTSLETVRAELSRRSAALRAETVDIGVIDEEEIRAAQSSVPPDIRIAVLPHAPLENMSFDTSAPAGIIALELQEKLSRLAGVQVKPINAVQRAYRNLALRETDNLLPTQINAALASRLDVDYVIWGRVDQSDGQLKADSGVFDGRTGDILAKGQAIVPAANRQESESGVVILASTLATNGYSPRNQAAVNQSLDKLLKALDSNQQAMSVPVAEDSAVQQWLLAAYRDLESATAYSLGDPDADGLLRSAETNLTKALEKDPTHPWANYLLANCLFNQAKVYATTNQQELMKKKSADVRPTLNRAYLHRRRPVTSLNKTLVLQIEADHALLVGKAPLQAAALYAEIVASPESPEAARRSATWMLLGLNLGDWGSTRRDPRSAHQAAVAILARWPDSPEAEFLRRSLRWREGEGALYAQLPLINQVVLK